MHADSEGEPDPAPEASLVLELDDVKVTEEVGSAVTVAVIGLETDGDELTVTEKVADSLDETVTDADKDTLGETEGVRVTVIELDDAGETEEGAEIVLVPDWEMLTESVTDGVTESETEKVAEGVRVPELEGLSVGLGEFELVPVTDTVSVEE